MAESTKEADAIAGRRKRETVSKGKDRQLHATSRSSPKSESFGSKLATRK
jgi:hypothetical protein